MSTGASPAYLLADGKKYRIRIHRSTITDLGDPKYIQLLVSPEKHMVAVRGVDTDVSGDQTHRVKRSKLDSEYCHEIYSRSFFEKLCEVSPELTPGCSYRLNGVVYPEKRTALFSLATIEKVATMGGDV